MSEERKLRIRNSTAEFLIFTGQSGEDGIEVRVVDGMVWLTQKLMGELFEISVSTVNEHLKNIFGSGECDREGTIRKFLIVRSEGQRTVSREIDHYNLDAIISMGYRVNSERATQFRQWATRVLSEFSVKGYVIDKERMENGSFFGADYFDDLLEEVREIRLSERKLYQKITDIYATSLDYDGNSESAKRFFAKVQNKLHFAIHGHTAAELIMERADSENACMGLTSWKNSPNGKILKKDVSVAKNYLKADELASLGRIVGAYLDLAEDRAKRKIPMSMADWSERLDVFLEFDDRDVLADSGKVTAEIAADFAESEFEKFRVVQDRLYLSDFDRFLEGLKG